VGNSEEAMSGVKTARSISSNIVDDNAVISLNLGYFARLCVFAGALGWSGYQLLDRLEDVERKLDEATLQIGSLLDKHIHEEQLKRKELEEKISFYEKEFNINPLSWGKKRKKK
jgi:hypothetical protein